MSCYNAGFLGTRFQAERTTPPTDIGGYDERRLIKISLSQKISPEEVAKASGGIEIVSQEDGTLVLAFATDAQLEEFEARLSSLAVGDHVTYKNLLYALQDFDGWTRDDRTGFALKSHGFPESESFKMVRAASLDQVAAWFNAAVDAESLARIKERSTGRSLSETARSKGTVQAASWRFTQPSQEIRESRWFVVVTRNDPPWGQDLCSETEPYGLAITLDDRFTPRLQIAPSLHAQTQLRLRERVRARVGR